MSVVRGQLPEMMSWERELSVVRHQLASGRLAEAPRYTIHEEDGMGGGTKMNEASHDE